SDAAAAARKIVEFWQDALRPRRRCVEPRQIVRAADHAFVLEFVEDEVAVHRRAQRAKDAAGEKAVDADALGGMFARDPVRPVGLDFGRKVAPDREIAGPLHVGLPVLGWPYTTLRCRRSAISSVANPNSVSTS